MTEILKQLGDDHRRMAYLLDQLERELEVMSRAGDADFDLMRSIMEYMSRYPDVVHHPKEDLVFVHLRKLDPSLAELIDQLESEHEVLETSGRALLDTMAQVVDGAMVERETVATRGTTYIDLLRKHMRLENDGVFQAAAQLMPAAAWSEIAAAYADQQDPLFGPIVDKDFHNLFEVIKRDRAATGLR